MCATVSTPLRDHPRTQAERNLIRLASDANRAALQFEDGPRDCVEDSLILELVALSFSRLKNIFS
jgi:hypothetical protein